MEKHSGKVSVTTENIFPVIRQWLYSDKDIFVRELVSNCSDAVCKHKRLVEIGKAEAIEGDYRIDVIFDDKEKTIKFIDNGIGMSAEEIDKYINQIAFSGAIDFVTKYQEQSTDKSGIIGHFGLGFYSAFMVADEVSILSKSFVKDEPAVLWKSEDGMEYEVSDGVKETQGTEITLKLSEDAQAMFTDSEIRSILAKYCSFIPVDLYYKNADEEAEIKSDDNGEETKEVKEEKPINNKEPLWTKMPKDCKDEDYIEFYHSVFNDMRDPLFWIHLNMDYPFTLQGILYFPKTDNIYQTLEGRIKIYNHQVFVADNIEEIIPEFLFLLRGCLDCSDLPLNVSRSALQQDEYVKKLSGHIIRKVSDKLNDLFKKERESFEKYWSDISVFVKYGMMREPKFNEKCKDICLFKTVDGKYMTVKELTDGKDTVKYTSDAKAQAAYVDMAKKDGFDVVILDEEIDNNFISFLEYNMSEVHFKRVDSELSGETQNEETTKSMQEFFRSALGDDKLEVSAMAMGADNMPAFIRETEEARRMKEMREQFAKMSTGKEDDPYKDLDSMFPVKQDLVVNTDNPLISKLSALNSMGTKKEECDRLALHVFDQARLAHGSLDSEGLTRFLEYNSKLLAQSADNIC
ncbi:MAG: molecular chaperone HtpG [Clostridia bacterium]|nr:molecular chaperone HtpG [Clostridia bacterium]